MFGYCIVEACTEDGFVDQDDIGVDDGGLKRQFVDATAKQMGDLFVTNFGEKIELFDNKDKAGFLPQIDSVFNNLPNLDKVKAFYRAIGRICALCLLHNGSDGKSKPIPITSHCFPKLYRNCESIHISHF
jgi:hypothetical protein